MKRFVVFLAAFFLVLLTLQGALSTSGTGGTITTFSNGTNTYTVHTFAANGTFTVTESGVITVMVVAGGGGGGYDRAAGGGAGGLVYNNSFPVTFGQNYTVVVGAGGLARLVGGGAILPSNGGNSSFGSIIAVGGGAAGSANTTGVQAAITGGSGGGAYGQSVTTGAAGTAGQGNAGGNGLGSSPWSSGGGGGAGGVGQNGDGTKGGDGGPGLNYSINGSIVCYAGGGGGGRDAGTGGNAICGGGAAGNASQQGLAGTNGTGGGGGGGGNGPSQGGGRGGDGIVIVQYESPATVILTLALVNAVNGSTWPNAVTFSNETGLNLTGTLTFNYFNVTGTGFCVTYTGNGTGTNCTTTGSGDSTYFNTTNTTIVAASQTITAGAHQSIVNLSAYRLFLNSSISSFNATAGSLYAATTTGNISFKAIVGNQTVQVNVLGNYTKNVTCEVTTPLTTATCNATGIYDDLFKINATDALSGGAVTSFNVTATNASVGSVTVETTNGSAFIPLLQGYNWNFFMDADGYAHANVTTPANASTNFYEFSLLPTNSIFLYFYDEDSLASILQNVTVEYTDGVDTFTNVSSTGDMVLSELSPATWQLTVSSDGYETRAYFVTVGARSSQDLDVYLLNSSAAATTEFTIKDADTADLISGATITMQHNVAGNWVTIDQQESDAFGIAVFELENGKQYRFTIEADGYATKTGEFTRTASAYIVTLTNANTQSFTSYLDDFTYTTAPSLVNPNVTTFSITTSSADGRLEWFSVSVVLNGTTTTQNVTGSPSGGTASVVLNLTPYEGMTVLAVYRVKSTSFDDPLEVSRSWYIKDLTSGNYTFTDFMEHYADEDNGLGFTSRGIILTIVAVLLALTVGAFFGMEAAAVMVVLVYLAGGFYGWLHWSVVITIAAAIIGALVMKGRGG